MATSTTHVDTRLTEQLLILSRRRGFIFNWVLRCTAMMRGEQNDGLSRDPGAGRGTHIGDVPPSRPPFPGHILAPETLLFKPFSSSRDAPYPTLFFWTKDLLFKTNFCRFWLNFTTLTHNFSKFRSGEPSFKPKNKFRRPYLWKPERHIPTRTYGFCWLPLPGSPHGH